MEKRTVSKSPRTNLYVTCCLLGLILFGLKPNAFSANNVTQQSITVRGTVKDVFGDELPGVSVVEKGTTNGITTDLDGRYSIQLSKSNVVLQFSYVGFKTKEVTITTQQTVDVTLEEDLKQVDEIVVIGYGTLKKEEVTTAISSIKSDEFNIGSVKDAGSLIQGKVAGLSITNPSGDPSDNSQIMLRGTSSIYSSTSPLVLIDGVPGDINLLAPQDIESIDVLKDGSAAAIYGTRGTNGVILISTKRTKGKTPATIEYSGYVNIQSIARKPELLNAEDYKRLIAENINLVDNGYSTDWLDEIMRPAPISHMHNFNLNGGNGTSNYVASVNIRNNEGIFRHSALNQLNGRLNIDHSMFNNILKINVSVLGKFAESPRTNSGSNFNNTAYSQAIIRNPTDRVKDDDNNWVNRGIYMYDNPVALLDETTGYSKERILRLSGYIDIKPIPELDLKLLLSKNQRNRENAFYRTSENPTSINNGQKGYASRSYYSDIENLLEFSTEYNKMLGNNHKVAVLGGYSYQDNMHEEFGTSTFDFPSDEYTFDNLALGAALKNGQAGLNSYRSLSKLVGFFGRLNYNYENKYLLLASLRHEASTKFGDNYKWGMFPAVSVGWRMSEEKFMKRAKWIDDMKLRVGFGITGTAPTDSYLSLTRLSYGKDILVDGKWIKEIAPASNPNPDLRWEKKNETNIGLDLIMFKRRVSITLDYYNRLTQDMLWNYQVPVPPYLYNSIVANVGQVENRGFEFMSHIKLVETKKIIWTTQLTFSTNSNILKSLSNELYATTNDFFDTGSTGVPIQQATHRVQVGKPIGNFYGYKVTDIDDTGHWIMENAQGERIPSVNKTTNDKQILGNGLPRYYLDWNNTFQYKNFDLAIRMRGAFDFQILNFQRMYYENPSSAQNYNNLKSGFDLVYGKVRLAETQEYTSYYIENGDYWKIDNVTLGYSFNLSSLKFIRNAKVYLSASNLATFTSYKGIDPEVNRNGLFPGNDELNKYPTTRTYTLGVNINF
jgi:TonB-linked SusC/RagA family outer membrane protein